MQKGEQVIFQVKRHPIGIILMYIGAGFLLTILAVIAFVIAPDAATVYPPETVRSFGAALFFCFTMLVILFLLVATIVYWGNSWLLTSDSLTQVLQGSLFNRQSSQLSLANLEDVTSEQNGILAHIFGYGVLHVETAGEKSKFVFAFCPNPNLYAQKILDAREKFEQAIGQEPILPVANQPDQITTNPPPPTV